MNINPFKDDGSKLLDDMSLSSLENEDDSTWVPEDDEDNNINNQSFEDDNYNNRENQYESECKTFCSANRIDQVMTKPHFDHRDIAVLKSTNGLLCPGDLVVY